MRKREWEDEGRTIDMCVLDKSGGTGSFAGSICPYSTRGVDRVVVTELLEVGGSAEADGEEVVG